MNISQLILMRNELLDSRLLIVRFMVEIFPYPQQQNHPVDFNDWVFMVIFTGFTLKEGSLFGGMHQANYKHGV
jgi:hypothetical protein